jgi:hypothetical protein
MSTFEIDADPDGGRRPTGVCVIRAEPQDRSRLLISVTSTLDVEHGGVRESHPVTAPDKALRMVAKFLAECARSGRGDPDDDG